MGKDNQCNLKRVDCRKYHKKIEACHRCGRARARWEVLVFLFHDIEGQQAIKCCTNCRNAWALSGIGVAIFPIGKSKGFRRQWLEQFRDHDEERPEKSLVVRSKLFSWRSS